MKATWLLAASMSLAGILWVLAPQRVDTRRTIASPPLLTVTPGGALPAHALLGNGSATEASPLLPESGVPAGASDRERTLVLVRELLAKTSDRDIIDAVAGLTELEAEDFDDIRDVRKHALRLAEIAIGESAPPGEGVTPVIFARSVAPNGQTVLEGSAFHDQSRAIYAVFPTPSPASDAVYVKWQSTGSSEPLHFDRHPIEPSLQQNYVWLEPGDGWSAGTYQVEVFLANDAVSPLAVGRFDIIPIALYTPDGEGHREKIAELTSAK